MRQAIQSSKAFVGAGGSEPRVDAILHDTGEIRRLMTLPSGHSVYAMDLEPEHGLIAVGTRYGMIYLTDSEWNENHDEASCIRQLFQGAPILSVCWCNASLLASSDSVGRCLLWDSSSGRLCHLLETADGLICSLVMLPNNLLAGASSDGRLLLWQIPEGRLIRTAHLPPPPPLSALVHMLYWPAEHALVCPGSGGSMTLCDPDEFHIRHIEAHQGDLYAISIWEQHIATVGREDGRLRLWSSESNKPAKDLQAPRGVISMAMMGYSPAMILLVELQGNAFICSLEDENLQVVRRLDGKDYRAVAGQTAEKIRAFDARRKEDEAGRIANKIKENIDRGPAIDLGKEHTRLVELGYEHVSLALRAAQAIQKGNIVEAIGRYSSLMDFLPQDHPDSWPSMARYAALLEKAWHITEAAAIYKQILNVNPEYPFSIQDNDPARVVKLTEEENWIIEPDIPLDSIIESATIIGKQFEGRYAINNLAPRFCSKVKLNPEMVASKYSQVKNETRNIKLPTATIERLWWLSRKGLDELDLVMIGDKTTNSLKGLTFAVRVSFDGLNTLVIPAVVFNWPGDRKGGSTEGKNREALRLLKEIRDSDLSNAYLTAVQHALDHALRKLITENSPNRELR